MKKNSFILLITVFIVYATSLHISAYMDCYYAIDTNVERNDTMSKKGNCKELKGIENMQHQRIISTEFFRCIVSLNVKYEKQIVPVEYKTVVVKHKFRVQSARSGIGDEGFANI